MESLKDNYNSFPNKYGHFSEDGFEFIITRPDTPRPWVNIISNGDFGLAVSQAGGGFSWKSHVNLNRITRWYQDLIADNWGKWLYLRDLEDGALCSLAFQPVQAEYEEYRVRQGLGYSIFQQRFKGLETSWTIFAACDDPVEIWICRIKNSGSRKRILQLASYFEWNLGAGPDINREFHKIFIKTAFAAEMNAIHATKSLWEVPTSRGHWNTDWPYLAFHSLDREPAGWDTSKDVLIGRHGGFHNPKGIATGNFSRTEGRYQDAVASLATDLELAPGQEETVVFLTGVVEKQPHEDAEQKAIQLYQKFASPQNAKKELQRVKDFWRDFTSQVQVNSPDDSFDLLTNIWLQYQVFSGHLWARTGYYQQSGAYGFRDQMQSSQAWLPHDPAKMLEHAKMNARHQLQKGTVLHWWHPLTGKGLETNMTDDLLWLPFMLNRYFLEAGDFSVLQEVVQYYDGGEGTLQEHCLRAIEVVLGRFSERGLPLIGEGDWCDGFSAVGLDWKGESIWLGMFLYGILQQWADILEKYSPEPEPELAERYRQRASDLKAALNSHGWNGQWYLAATKDDGTPIGDPSQEECKIYLMSQTWAIINEVAEGERAQQVADAMLEYLESDNGLQLFQPAFRSADPYIGYITRYAAGVRENGGVYTHASTWGVLALAKLGRAEDAMRILRKLNPVLQTKKNVERYFAEPYVLPGNIGGKDSPDYGRAGWSWYTGSAGWLFTIALEAICGVSPTFDGLQIDPCIPAEWPELHVRRKFRGAVFEITIGNPDGKNGGVREIELDGSKIPGNIIPSQEKGVYQVKVVLE